MVKIVNFVRKGISTLRSHKDSFLYPANDLNFFWVRKRFYSQFLKRNDLVFDVGANHGNRVEIFLALGCKVVAFEPQPKCVSRLNEKFSSSSMFTCVAKAIGSETGELSLLCSPVDTLSTFSALQVERAKQSGRFNSCKNWDAFVELNVPVSTLEEECSNYGVPTFIKIDVEGFEYEVLRGLNTCVNALSFEFTAESLDLALNCLGRLDKLGNWQLNLCHGESMKFFMPQWLTTQEFRVRLSDVCSRLPYFGGDIYAKRV